MSDPIDRETFAHLVDLAALELDEAEGEYLRQQLNNQLKSIRQLEAIPIDPNTPINLHGISYTQDDSPALRADQWLPFEDVADILSQVPELEENYIIVPDIPHTELE
jgi:aspartyl-tRNA(Asn)/glutamyl-tRNA(Gln) amidotransferase subunit C